MSNAERRVQNVEVEIRELYGSRIATNKVLILDTNYLILLKMSNTEHRLKNEEVEIRES